MKGWRDDGKRKNNRDKSKAKSETNGNKTQKMDNKNDLKSRRKKRLIIRNKSAGKNKKYER